MADTPELVSVFVRVRPSLSVLETTVAGAAANNAELPSLLTVANESTNTLEMQLYETCVQAGVRGALGEGRSYLCMAYGQTSAGKTYTCTGGGKFNDRGLVQRVCSQVYAYADACAALEGVAVRVHINVVQVYKEDVYDLLQAAAVQKGVAGKQVSVQEGKDGRLVLRGAACVECGTEQSALRLLLPAVAARATADTTGNAASSRSHALYTFTVDTVDEVSGTAVRRSVLTVVDLAGSERQGQGQGQRMATASEGAAAAGTGDPWFMHDRQVVQAARGSEGRAINLSLHHLEACMVALSSPPPSGTGAGAGGGAAQHVPFRSSTLTLLLRDHLCPPPGYLPSACALIACVSPERCHVGESVSTVRFAARCARVELKARRSRVEAVPAQHSAQAKQEANAAGRKAGSAAGAGPGGRGGGGGGSYAAARASASSTSRARSAPPQAPQPPVAAALSASGVSAHSHSHRPSLALPPLSPSMLAHPVAGEEGHEACLPPIQVVGKGGYGGDNGTLHACIHAEDDKEAIDTPSPVQEEERDRENVPPSPLPLPHLGMGLGMHQQPPGTCPSLSGTTSSMGGHPLLGDRSPNVVLQGQAFKPHGASGQQQQQQQQRVEEEAAEMEEDRENGGMGAHSALPLVHAGQVVVAQAAQASAPAKDDGITARPYPSLLAQPTRFLKYPHHSHRHGWPAAWGGGRATGVQAGQERWVWLDVGKGTSEPTLCWSHSCPGAHGGGGQGKVSRHALAQAMAVVRGCATPSLKKAAAGADPSLCFSVLLPSRTIDLQAESVGQREAWVQGLCRLLCLPCPA